MNPALALGKLAGRKPVFVRPLPTRVNLRHAKAQRWRPGPAPGVAMPVCADHAGFERRAIYFKRFVPPSGTICLNAQSYSIKSATLHFENAR
jgi:hypothetical protein